MRTSVLVLAALALSLTRASADTGAPIWKLSLASAKKGKTQPEAQGLLNSLAAQPAPQQLPPQPDIGLGASPQDSAPDREASIADSAIFQPSTPSPLAKYVGPIIGGVVGAGALAGVIAISVMKKPKTNKAAEGPPALSARVADGSASGAPAQTATPISTSLTNFVSARDSSIQVQSSSEFADGDTIKVGSEYNMVARSFQVQGNVIPLDHPMNTDQPNGATVTIVHDVRAKVAVTVAPSPAAAPALLPRNVGTTTVAPNFSSGSKQWGETQVAIAVMLVVCGLLAVCLIALLFVMFARKKRAHKTQLRRQTPYLGGGFPEDQQPLNRGERTMMDMPHTLDLCESQYMQVQVRPLAPGQGMGSVPTMQNVVPMQTMPPPPPPPVAMSYASQPSRYSAGVAPGSYHQNASPLANTVNALPTTVFNMGGMPTMNLPQTIYN